MDNHHADAPSRSRRGRRRVTPLIIFALCGIVGLPAPAAVPFDATIERTTFGIPHVRSGTYGGLGYGAGYTIAEDNLCVVAEKIMTVRGERSQYLGPGNATAGFQQISNLESDIYHRIVGDLPELREAFGQVSAEYAEFIRGYSAGYNRYLRDARGGLPRECASEAWVRPMTLDDALLLLNSLAIETGASGLARQLAGATPPSAAVSGSDIGFPPLPDASAFGSNGWAFGGEATANGRGLVVGNPHFPWQGANRFHQIHLTIPGTLNVMGAGLTYTPFVAIGFNSDVAWTHTVSTARHFTLFELSLLPDDPTTYLVDGRPEPMTRRELRIAVKDADPVIHTVFQTRYGPVVSMPQAGLGWTQSRAYALRDANLFNLRAGDAWLRMSRARSASEVRQIIGETLGIPYVNTIAADRGGEALYADVSPMPNVSGEQLTRCATAASQAAAAQRLFILDGGRSDCAWQEAPGTPRAGLMPQAGMPTLFRRDYVQNSNDSYRLSNPEAPLPAAEPMFGPTDAPPNPRTQSGILEIRNRLSGGDGLPGNRFDHASARAVLFANKSLTADRMLEDLIAICEGDAALEVACNALRSWDRHANLESRGALLFFEFLRRLAPVDHYWAVPFDPGNALGTPSGLVRDEPKASEIRAALGAAANELASLNIPLDAPLGAYQVVNGAGHAVPVHGGPHPAGILNVIFSRPANGMLNPVTGSSYIQIVGFDESGPIADSVLTYSQSSSPGSPHFADQTPVYAGKRLHRLPFAPREIAQARIARPLRIRE